MTPEKRPHPERRTYPFSAILGQERMKLALLLNAINPAIGGVVIRGQKGTAKSTAARGLSALMPALAQGRRPPFVDFPLGATEDMVVGAIDLEAAIRQGVVAFQPGLLARAHNGVLYVDEINLLNDHLADSILDASESGENIVEREGQSLRHESRFILIGTMNPEEGEVRPQLLDRFGLAVSVEGEREPALRVELLKRREAFDLDADAFIARFRDDEAELAGRIVAARRRLREVFCPAHLSGFIAEICQRNHVAGHRADIVMDRAARAHAAWRGADDVSADDILAVAPMVLLHRMRTAEPEVPPPPPPPEDRPDEQAREEPQDQDSSGDQDDASSPASNTQADRGDPGGSERTAPPESDESAQQETSAANDEVAEIGAAFTVRKLDAQARDRVFRTGSGKRSRSRSACKQGRYVKSAERRDRNDLAFDATLRAAAPHQKTRRETATRDLAVHIADSDIREKIRERRVGNFLLFIVDGSGSMGAHRRMVETKAAIMSLLLDAYQKRDKVAMVVFRGRCAETVLPPTNSVERAAKLLADLPVGGRTPLSQGLETASQILRQVERRDPAALPLAIVLTDGRANAGLGCSPPHEEALRAAAQLRELHPAARFVVVDTEAPGVVRLELARKLADALNASYFKTEDLRAEDLVALAKETQTW